MSAVLCYTLQQLTVARSGLFLSSPLFIHREDTQLVTKGPFPCLSTKADGLDTVSYCTWGYEFLSSSSRVGAIDAKRGLIFPVPATSSSTRCSPQLLSLYSIIRKTITLNNWLAIDRMKAFKPLALLTMASTRGCAAVDGGLMRRNNGLKNSALFGHDIKARSAWGSTLYFYSILVPFCHITPCQRLLQSGYWYSYCIQCHLWDRSTCVLGQQRCYHVKA